MDLHHRHHRAPQGALFAIGLSAAGVVVGVAIVGRPVSRHLAARPYLAEVTRLCVLEGTQNACSQLYGAAWRAARALGYRELITYTLLSERGTSLKAAGWRSLGQCGGGTWSSPSRPRVDKHPTEPKQKWIASMLP